MIIPKIAAVHDLSCFGRCSLSVIIPILSKLSTQVCPLPTSVLSTHLGGYSHISATDFTDKMTDIYTAWQSEQIQFNCIYTGYLASDAQIATVNDFIDKFNEHSLVVVDPVMGDNGKLYSKYTSQMQTAMRQLITRADIITPNYTEACFLLEEEYIAIHTNLDKIYSYLVRLAEFGSKKVVITGVHLADNSIANVAYDADTQEFFTTYSPKVPAHYPGTGDIFTSSLIGYLLLDFSLDMALLQATRFVYECIDLTYKLGTQPREGVLLESLLDMLTREGVTHEY